MLRGIIAFVVLLAITAVIGWQWYRSDAAFHERQAKRIEQLEQQVGAVQSDNNQLKAALAKVSEEQNRLNTDNQALRLALEQAKIIARIPRNLPSPPK